MLTISAAAIGVEIRVVNLASNAPITTIQHLLVLFFAILQNDSYIAEYHIA
jgi:hypothetical protein